MFLDMRAAIYTRISSDTTGKKAGVARQEKECRALVEARGWTTTGAAYIDNDKSAYSGKARPEYVRLLADIDAGDLDALVVWHPDRLHRSPVELEGFIDLVEKRNIEIATVQGGSYDLTTASGRMTARVVGAVSRHESEHKSERHKAKALELARQGKPSGGGTRPFGFEDDQVTIRESEAGAIRDAASRLLDGESIRSTVAMWNQSAVHTPTGRQWTPANFTRMMKSPRIAGLRSYQGTIIGEALWDAIVDPANWYSLTARFSDNARRMKRSPRRYLLTSGLAVCGLCGAGLVARPRGDGRRCYVCAKGPGFHGCGKIRVLADPLEEWVRDCVIEAVSGEGLAEALAETGTDTRKILDQISTLEESLDQLATDHYADKRIGRHEFFTARDAIEERIEALRSDIATNTTGKMVADLPAKPEHLRQLYDVQTLEWQRQLVELVVESVTANPAVKGRNFFDPDRFDIRWRV